MLTYTTFLMVGMSCCDAAAERRQENTIVVTIEDKNTWLVEWAENSIRTLYDVEGGNVEEMYNDRRRDTVTVNAAPEAAYKTKRYTFSSQDKKFRHSNFPGCAVPYKYVKVRVKAERSDRVTAKLADMAGPSDDQFAELPEVKPCYAPYVVGDWSEHIFRLHDGEFNTLRIMYVRGKMNMCGPNMLDLMIMPFQETATRKYDREWEQFLNANLYCADCDADIRNSPQVFFSSDFGVFLCLTCSGHHRDNQDLVRAVQLDEDCPNVWRRLKDVQFVGNRAVNVRLGLVLKLRSVALRKPRPTSDKEEKLAYIRAKYFERPSHVRVALAAATVPEKPRSATPRTQIEQHPSQGKRKIGTGIAAMMKRLRLAGLNDGPR